MFINTCRICLKSGEIPIFGREPKPDLSPEIVAFGDIKVCQNDGMPQNLCNACYALLQNAILFRDMAKKSEIAIKYQKILIAEGNLSNNEEYLINSWNIKKHSSDHNYSRSESVNMLEQSFNRDNYDPQSEETNTQTTKIKCESKSDVLASKTEKSKEIGSTATCCKICNINFETPNDFYVHDLTPAHIYNVNNLGRIECDICKTKMNRSYYLRHLLYHSYGQTPLDGNRHICRICNKILLTKVDIKIHRLSEMHKMAVKTATKIECPVCHAILKRAELQKHLSHHASEVANRVKQKCPLCSIIMSYSHYAYHLKRKHNIDLINKPLDASPNLQLTANKSKAANNCQKKSTKEENLSIDNEELNKEMINTEDNSFNHDLQEDTAEILEPYTSNEDFGFENGKIPIEENINEIYTNIDPYLTILVVTDTEDTQNNEKQLIENNAVVNPVHTCEICNLNFQTSDDYYEHIGTPEHISNEKQSPKINCNICRKTINKGYYVTHLKFHCFKPIPTGDVYTCKICNEILLSSSDAKTHASSESHKISEQAACEIECPVCQMIIERIHLTIHLQYHAFNESSWKLKCKVCGKYVGFKHYDKHLREMHKINKIREGCVDNQDNTTSSTENKIKSYVCDICGKAFHKACVFRGHSLTHNVEKKYKCEFCPYRSTGKGLLRSHLKTHLGMYNHECDKCPGRKFISKSNLIKHLKTHRGPIDFECEMCHKGFYNKADLKRHVEAVHLGMRNYVCHLCNNKFAYKSYLRRHQVDVHNFAKKKSKIINKANRVDD